MDDELDAFEQRQQYLAELRADIAQGQAELAARREQRRIDEAMAAASDWRHAGSLNEMTDLQFGAWIDAGRPPLAAETRAAPAAQIVYKTVEQPAPRARKPATPMATEAMVETLATEVGGACGELSKRLRHVEERMARIEDALVARAVAEIGGNDDLKADLRRELSAMRSQVQAILTKPRLVA